MYACAWLVCMCMCMAAATRWMFRLMDVQGGSALLLQQPWRSSPKLSQDHCGDLQRERDLEMSWKQHGDSSRACTVHSVSCPNPAPFWWNDYHPCIFVLKHSSSTLCDMVVMLCCRWQVEMLHTKNNRSHKP
jgi:hypothetical protein